MWEWWLSARKRNELTGEWEINFPAFAVVVPRAVQEDDETRLEVVRLMQLCAATENNPKASLIPDTEEE